MRVDECEVGGHLPSHQDWKKKKKKKRKEKPGAQQRPEGSGDRGVSATVS
jgi:hypothetical protein